jgi:hypothetical protein
VIFWLIILITDLSQAIIIGVASTILDIGIAFLTSSIAELIASYAEVD